VNAIRSVHLLDVVREPAPRHEHAVADGANYRTHLVDGAVLPDFTIGVFDRSEAAQGFEVLRADRSRSGHSIA
jgi:hypothetical protein